MLSVSKMTYYMFWYSLFSTSAVSFMTGGLLISMSGPLCLSVVISFWDSTDFVLSLSLTFSSMLFSFVVSLITISVFSFSLYYMSSSTKTPYFTLLTVLFVISMLIVINFSDLLMIMLGWDGLGVVSFFLIVFYQSPASIFSGVFTLMMNRVGDALLLVSLVLMAYTSLSWSLVVSSSYYPLVVLFILGLMTKSAIFPFSSWLPAAMAAPTPISSLVHSSTLVTAGLYLMMRYSDYFYFSQHLLSVLCVAGVFTSFYAGINSLFEVDLKKIVALSTLSHLGFITMSFSMGWLTLAFAHLLSHAAFKSLLFMTLGSLMTGLGHYQESRYLSSGEIIAPLSCSLMACSSFSLLGFPFFSGFYSKDLILETLGYSSVSWLLYSIIFLNVVMTYSYTMRVLSSSFYYSKFNVFSSQSQPPLILVLSLMVLGVTSVSLILILSKMGFITIIPLATCLELKYYPLITVLIVTSLFFLLLPWLFKLFSPHLLSWTSSMFYLSLVVTSFTSRLWLTSAPSICKTTEAGVLSLTFNTSLTFLGMKAIPSFLSTAMTPWGLTLIPTVAITLYFLF